MFRRFSFAAVFVGFLAASVGCATWWGQRRQPLDLSAWPKGRAPEDVGLHVAQHFVASPRMEARPIIYPEFCAWYGAGVRASHRKKRVGSRFDQAFSVDSYG